MSDFLDIPFERMDGSEGKLRDYPGVKLVVNVASLCLLTEQYGSLQKLYDEKKDSGLQILAFPANDFMEQEPGSNDEILNFCQTEYAVTFPVFSKVRLIGADKHPLFEALTTQSESPEGAQEFRDLVISHGGKPDDAPGVIWNFEKFLIDADGEIIGRFLPTTTVDEPAFRAAVDAALNGAAA